MTCNLQQQQLLQPRRQRETSPARRQEQGRHSGIQPSLPNHKAPNSKSVVHRKDGRGSHKRRPLMPRSSETHAVTNAPAPIANRNQKGASNPHQACRSTSDSLSNDTSDMHYSSSGSEHNWLWPYAQMHFDKKLSNNGVWGQAACRAIIKGAH